MDKVKNNLIASNKVLVNSQVAEWKWQSGSGNGLVDRLSYSISNLHDIIEENQKSKVTYFVDVDIDRNSSFIKTHGLENLNNIFLKTVCSMVFPCLILALLEYLFDGVFGVLQHPFDYWFANLFLYFRKLHCTLQWFGYEDSTTETSDKWWDINWYRSNLSSDIFDIQSERVYSSFMFFLCKASNILRVFLLFFIGLQPFLHISLDPVFVLFFLDFTYIMGEWSSIVIRIKV